MAFAFWAKRMTSPLPTTALATPIQRTKKLAFTSAKKQTAST